MTTLIIPQLEEEPWPTLGPQICRFIEEGLVFGPGDLRGQPAKVSPEKRLLIYRAYEVYPEGHQNAGRRRFRRCVFSMRKGLAKTELAAWLAAVELHPEAPVRCDGFREGQPIGRPVTDPYIPMVAYTEEQTEDLAYAALYTMLSEGPLVDDFDIGLTRIMRKKGDGKAVALAAAPDARDGARTTFEHFDETHRFVLPRLKMAHKTMLANLPKRRIADAWALETTTAYAAGEASIAEEAMIYARSIEEGKTSNPQLFFFHRQASDHHDISTDDGLKAAVLEASGADAEWSDIDGICAQFDDPTADSALLQRLWLNRPIAGSGKAFDSVRWAELRMDFTPPEGSLIVLGFDGSVTQDATALIATHIETGYQWPLGIWERPANAPAWHVPEAEVDAAVADAFARYNVWRMNADPPKWETWVSAWQGRYGEDVVRDWYCWRPRPMGIALMAYANAMQDGHIHHDGNRQMAAHIANTVKEMINLVDDDGKQLWKARKERPDSPFKIDAAIAGTLSWEARNAAVAAGMLDQAESSVMFV